MSMQSVGRRIVGNPMRLHYGWPLSNNFDTPKIKVYFHVY